MPFRPIAGGGIVVLEFPFSHLAAAFYLGEDAAWVTSEVAIGPTTAIDIEAREKDFPVGFAVAEGFVGRRSAVGVGRDGVGDAVVIVHGAAVFPVHRVAAEAVRYVAAIHDGAHIVVAFVGEDLEVKRTGGPGCN